MLVRPYVLCTKTFNQRGPCTKASGNPDIGNCQIDCGHRLELAAARQDCRASIEDILVEIAGTEGMERIWWQGQLLAHLTRFEDLKRVYLEDDQVRQALVGVSEWSIDQLEGDDARMRARQIVEG
jgi:hypothetical protein